MSNQTTSATRVNAPLTPEKKVVGTSSTQGTSTQDSQTLSSNSASSNREAAKSKVEDAANQTKEKAHAHADARMTEAGEEVEAAADDLRSAATDIDNQFISTALTGASAQLRKAADYLTENEPRDTMGHLQELGRQSPAMFLAGAFALGLAIGQVGRIAVPQEHDPSTNTNSNSFEKSDTASFGDQA